MFRNPFLGLRKREWLIWLVSLAVVTISALISGNRNIFTLITTLIFFFNDMYGFVSWKKRERRQK